ncbi:MAG: roadblock/LC7 family protein [bacterium]|nr:MAG: roadblock/LC7 family protein [bacterium]
MAIEGDLKNISLTGLVQVICLERKTGELVLVRRGQEGVIFFEKGEIVHAKLDSLIGEEALFSMLSWIDGNFRITDKVTVIAKTISINWNHLLMEGMRRIDERKNEFDLPPTGDMSPIFSQADIEKNTTLRDDVILLIGQLEQYIPKLSDKKVTKKPSIAIELLKDMVHLVLEQAELVARNDQNIVSLRNLFVKLNERYPQARLLHIDNNRLSVQTLINLYSGWASNTSDRNHTFRQISYVMVELLEYYFSFLVNSIHLMNLKDEVEETSGVLIMDLKKTLDKINF